MPVEKIGSYEILESLGESRFGAAYSARSIETGQGAALKLIPLRAIHDPSLYARLSRQVEVLGLLGNPAIAPVYAVTEQGEYLALAMRRFSGGSLRERLKGGPLALPEAVRVMMRLALALDAAHAAGLVHQDIHPGNVLFDPEGNAWLADFGSHLLAEACLQPGEYTLLGPPAFQSPEQARVQTPIDSRSDIYALGMLFYQMLTGSPACPAATTLGAAAWHLAGPTPQVSTGATGLPAWVNTVLERALAKDPDQRYLSAGELAAGLQAGLDGAASPQHGYAGAAGAGASVEAPDGGDVKGRMPYAPTDGGKTETRPPEASARKKAPRGGLRPGWALLAVLALLAALVWIPIPGMGMPGLQALGLRMPGLKSLGLQIPGLLALGQTTESSGMGMPGLQTPGFQVTGLSVGGTPAENASPETAELPRMTPEHEPFTPTAAVMSAAAAPTPTPTNPPSSTLPVPEPAELPAVTAAAPLTYTIQYNDTLFTIASRFNLDLSNFIAINDLTCDSRLRPQKEPLLLPAAGLDRFPGAFKTISGQNAAELQWKRILECVKDVRDLHFSPDGQTLAVAQENYIYQWRTADWKPIRRLKGHLSTISSFDFSPDGAMIASAADDRTIRIWSAVDGTLLKTLKGHRAEIINVVFHPNGQTIASTSTDLSVRIWDVVSGKQTHELRGYKAYGAAYSADGSLLAVGYGDSVRLYDTADYRQTASMPSPEIARELAFHPGGSLLASSSDVWHVGEQKLVYHLQSSGDQVTFTKDGELLIAGKRFYQLSNGTLRHTLKTPLDETPRTLYAWESLALDPDGRLLAWGTQDGLSIWAIEGSDPATAANSRYLAAAGDNYLNIAEKFKLNLTGFLGDNTLSCKHVIYLGQPLNVSNSIVTQPLSYTNSPAITPNNVGTLSEKHAMNRTCTAPYGSLSFSPDDSLLASGANLWDLSRDSLLVREDNAAFLQENAAGVVNPAPLMVFSPSGKQLAVRSGKEIKLWDAASGRLLRTLSGHTDNIAGMAFSPNGKLLASGSGTGEGNVRLWNPEDGSLVRILPGFAAKNLTFIPPDGDILMASWEENTIRFWRVEDGTLLPSLQGIDGSTALSPDGKTLAYVTCNEKEGVVCKKRVVNLYNLEKGVITHTYAGLTEQIQDVAWSPDGSKILCASAYAILEWDIASNTLSRKLEPGPAKRQTITEIFLALDNKLLFAITDEQRIDFWDYANGKLAASLYRPYESIAFSSANNLIALLSGGQVTLWGVKP